MTKIHDKLYSRMKLLIVVFFGCLFGYGRSEQDLEGTTWVAQNFFNELNETIPLILGSKITILFEEQDNIVSGYTGCNWFNGEYATINTTATELTRLKIHSLAWTERACLDRNKMEQESYYLKMLPRVAFFHIDQESRNLFLKDENGTSLIVYTPCPLTLDGTFWSATSINAGRNSLTFCGNCNTEVTAVFDENTHVLVGSGGCNMYSAQYNISGNNMIIRDLVSPTDQACFPDSIMEQESNYFAALQKVSNFKIIDCSDLILIDNLGAHQVKFISSESNTSISNSSSEEHFPGFIGYTWYANTIYNGDSVLSVVEENLITIAFDLNPDTKGLLDAGGSAGCNSYSTTFQYNTSESSLMISDEIIQTDVACMSTSVTTQESAYLQVLSSVAFYTFKDDQLKLYDDSKSLLVSYVNVQAKKKPSLANRWTASRVMMLVRMISVEIW